MTPNRNVFQIFISDGGHGPPPAVTACIDSVRQSVGDYDHRLMDGEQLREIIAAQFEPRVLAAYDRLVPYAYKADLGRYCLLHKYGGWYADVAVTLRAQLGLVSGIEHILFRDAPRPAQQAWETSNTLIYAVAGSPIMQAAIDIVVRNCEARDYGVNALDPTGPGALGRAVAAHGPDPKIVTGIYMPLTPSHPQKNLAFVLPDGTIMAFGKQSAGTEAGNMGLEVMGAQGVNRYHALYQARQIYAD